MFYEAYIAKLEDLVNGLAEDIINDVEPAADIEDQILAAYNDTDKYLELSTDEQYDRYNDIDELVQIIYGVEDEEE